MYLIPKPQEIKMLEGIYRIGYSARITMDAHSSHDLYFCAKQLREAIRKSTGMTLQIDRQEASRFGGVFLTIEEKLENEYSREAYEITVDENGIRICGASAAGALYAVQTLRQVLLQEGARVPYLYIKDYPQLKNRGFYYDVTRGRIPTLDYLKTMADRLSFYKINQLQLYIEHSFLFKEFSEVWRDDTPLTSDDILELDEYCKERNIELIPSVASFGHLYKVLRTKSMRHLSEIEEKDGCPFSFIERGRHYTVNVSDDNALAMVKEMLAEYIPLFTSSHFNICCDETFDLGRGKSRKLREQYGADRLYVEYLKKICDFVGSFGKQVMFWDDIIMSAPETIRELPEDIICLTWDYELAEGDTGVRTIYEQGANQYLCPGIHSWACFINDYDKAYKNVKKMTKFAWQFDTMGILNTCWGDYGHMSDSDFHIIGMIYGAADSWNVNITGQEELNAAISRVEYGDTTETFVSIVNDMSRQYSFTWNEFVQYMEKIENDIGDVDREQFWRNIQAFEGEKLHHISDINAAMDADCDRLTALLPHMAEDHRHHVYAYIVMAEGQKLVNLTAAVIDQYVYGNENEAAMDPKILASKLEWWLYEYKKLWRSTSQESELYRIANVYYWYADYLRSL